jgi:hypothetical protein
MDKNPYVPPEMQKHLDGICAEARALLANSRLIQTDEGRAIMTMLARLIETLATGAPQTESQKRHHE